MPRKDASPQLRARVRHRLGRQCAACDSDKAAIDVAHLYEDATKRRPSEDRLILLCSDCNQAQARGKYQRMGQHLNDPSAPAVAHLAIDRYWRGNYPGAYQSALLAAYLYSRVDDRSARAEYLTHALSALRPLRWGDLMRSVLFAFEGSCEAHHVDLVPRWLFLDRLALALFDFGKRDLASQVLNASLVLRSQLRADQRNQRQLERDLMSSFRREAMISAFSGMRDRAWIRSSIRRLREDAEVFLKMDDSDGFATNLDVAAKLEVEMLADEKRALANGERAMEAPERIGHKWVLQEHHWRLAALYRSKQSRRNEEKHVVAALREFARTPVALEPILLGNELVKHDPIRDLATHGYSEQFLRDQGVAPTQNAPHTIPLRLRNATIERIVRRVLRN